MELNSDEVAAEILVVDDTAADRQFLAEVVRRYGYRVREADSGERALEAVVAAVPDLILLDVDMPGMSGFALCNALKRSPQHAGIPVIFISVFDDAPSKVAAFNCGGIDYVVKPINVAELRARVHAHLQQKQARDRLDFRAGHDPLTGLPNRSLLADRLQQALNHAERYGSQVAVAYVDLDRFKDINDRFGHDAGDRLLREIAGRLRGCVRDSDTIVRVGGDEFVLVLHDQGSESMTLHAVQRVLERVVEPISLGDCSFSVSCSIGVACFPQDGGDGDTLLTYADAAMYRAKELGRNNFQFYTSALNSRLAARMAMENGLRQALDRDEFVLHYQPRAATCDGRVTGLEALIRWQHPERGLLPPRGFIRVAEEAGLIDRIGDWIVRAACRQHGAWQAQGIAPLPIAVNVSGVQFRRAGFARSLAAVLREHGIAPQWLELEFAESLLMRDPAASVGILGELRDLGVGLALDDFGTGFSNFGWLKKFPLDRIKLDPGFTVDAVRDADTRAVLDAVIAVAHNLRLKVTAESVESLELLAALTELGCDEIQGDYFSNALPVHACTGFLRRGWGLPVAHAQAALAPVPAGAGNG